MNTLLEMDTMKYFKKVGSFFDKKGIKLAPQLSITTLIIKDYMWHNNTVIILLNVVILSVVMFSVVIMSFAAHKTCQGRTL